MAPRPISWSEKQEDGSTLEVFGSFRQWYWRKVKAGRIVAVGGEPFTRKWSAKRAGRAA
jgi:hypothetical protein